MNSDTTVFVLMGICLCIMIVFVFSKPFKLLGKFIINSGIGLFAFIGTNFLLSPFSVSVGINALTLTIVGVLGVPGFVCLYLSQLIL